MEGSGSEDPLLKGVELLSSLAAVTSGSISSKDVAAAGLRIAPHVHRTPVVSSKTLNDRVGVEGLEFFFKCENFQKIGAFKARGATNAVLATRETDPNVEAFLTHSSGNHGQALAFAASLVSMKAKIVVPKDAPKAKIDAMKGYGADLIFVDAADRESTTLKLAEANTNMKLIHPSNEPLVIAGQGTIFLEFFMQVEGLQAIVVPVGGGGMISGIAVAAKALKPDILVIGAEPELADDAFRSRQIREMQGHQGGKIPQTIADGLKTTLGSNTWPVVRDYVDEIITVSEAEIIDSMRFVFERMKLVIEPSAAVGVAAIQTRAFKETILGKHVGLRRVGVVICGGNVAFDTKLPWL